MSFFSSDRERKLWIQTAVVVLTIYSTLGLARKLSGYLRDRELLDTTFLFGFMLIGIAVFFQAIKKRPSGREIGIGLGIIAVYLMAFTRMGIPEERTHLIEYSIVALFIYEALKERISNAKKVPIPALLTIVATGLLGAIDECIQAFLPNRVFDPMDMLFNFLAGIMAVSASVILTWANQRFNSK